ncbi:hypothetical protein PTI98_004968 [Pleurotus ostreatus]|nr:hypothetical protein PTI98_004968 [Pleurotus ostreatus]
MFNNASLIHSLKGNVDQDKEPRPLARPRVSSEPCLPERLPSGGFLQREAEYSAPRAILRQLRRSPSPPQTPVDEEADEDEEQTTILTDTPESPMDAPPSPTFSIKSAVRSVLRAKSFQQRPQSTPWKEPQPFEVFRAVEQKDIMFLMEIRDRAFPTGDATPLLHAMRIGQSHRDVAIILVGAFSRWVNNLEDVEIVKPKTRVLLKALRANLKLAIDLGLAKSQSDLTASFMQTLIMSEGERWVRDQASNVSLALRAGTAGKPVETASAAVRRFTTKELGKASLIAALEDYIANATVDLLVLGAWAWATETIDAQLIPTYYFARDDRVFKALCDRLRQHESELPKLSRRLRWQLRVLKVALEGKTTTFRRKVELLSAELDEGDGL